jgi:hypothetical protein
LDEPSKLALRALSVWRFDYLSPQLDVYPKNLLKLLLKSETP